MNRVSLLFASLAAMIVASTGICRAQTSSALTLDLVIGAADSPVRSDSVAAAIIIKNTGDEPVTVEHPHNRMAVAFILLDSLGNVVSPEGRAKVDPLFQQVTIQPHSEYKHRLDGFEFLTGSALFGYTLSPGKTYRVTAIYRPYGRKQTGITSPERAFCTK